MDVVRSGSRVLVLLLVLALGGCGSSDSSGAEAPGGASARATATPTPEAPSRAEYVAEVDAICAGKTDIAGARARDRLTVTIGKAGDELNAALRSGASTDAILDRVGRLHVRLADMRDERIAEVKAVAVPADGGPRAFLRRFDRTTTLVRDFAAATPRMDGPWQRWLTRFSRQSVAISRAAAGSRKAARAYGLKRCETPPKR